MSDPQLRWLRLWTDILSDPKVRMLAFEDRWHFVAILCMKRRGDLDGVSGDLLERMVGVTLGLGDRDRDEVKRRLGEVQLIDGHWQPMAWGKRQFSSDADNTAAERQRRYRERLHGVTRESRVTHGRVTRPETETETEQRQSKKAASPGLNALAWEKWLEYRKRRKPPIRPESIEAAQKELAKFGDEQMAVVEHSIAQGYQGLYAPKTNPTKGDTGWRPTA